MSELVFARAFVDLGIACGPELATSGADVPIGKLRNSCVAPGAAMFRGDVTSEPGPVGRRSGAAAGQ
ncbi:unnamed protein product [Leptidea sinapis]|uniref:Uncharacterized protein n=1 Tax=Leptidea sinapis TaxID=189913 RepID=A0A5E4QYN4_9NEOP|nr:unnamed protein product [Leptidea sinapis]